MKHNFTSPIIYVTRDIERAAAGCTLADNFYIVSNATAYAKNLQEKYPEQIILIDDENNYYNTYELLAHKKAIQLIKNTPYAHIVVFKNSTRIERICQKQNWNLLNPSAQLARTVEEKISQVTWLDELSSLLPKHKILSCKELSETDIPSVVQFNHGHTGTGTLQLKNTKTLVYLQQTFPDRPVRVSDYIDGMMFTLNVVVTSEAVETSTISYQITGLPPFTDNTFATIGNDWVFPKKVLSDEQSEYIHTIAKRIGKKLQEDSWNGLFGIDVIVEKHTKSIYLIEINARQPASTTYESSLQSLRPTTFEAHLTALLQDEKKAITPVLSGAQLFDRRIDPPTVHYFDSGIMAEHNILSANISL